MIMFLLDIATYIQILTKNEVSEFKYMSIEDLEIDIYKVLKIIIIGSSCAFQRLVNL